MPYVELHMALKTIVICCYIFGIPVSPMLDGDVTLTNERPTKRESQK